MVEIQSAGGPIFHNAPDDHSQVRSLSGWAVLSLVVGLSCFLVPLAYGLLPLAVLAVILGGIVSLKLSAPEADLGLWMANFCLGMGIMSGTWVFAAYKTNAGYLTHHAVQHAEDFIGSIQQGRLYEAMELSKPVGMRQPEGIDLEQYYESYQGDISLDLIKMSSLIPSGDDGPPNPEKDRKVAASVFKNSPATVFIQQHPQAKWNLVQVKQIKESGDTTLIKMIMQCSDSSSKRLLVDAMRQQTASVDAGRSAEWRIGSISVE
jgi:hypothetical protein